ncbi:MAG: hypothetical protein RJQ04_14905 [Longimicrobiales bacterium]
MPRVAPTTSTTPPQGLTASPYGPHAARALGVAGLVYLVGSLVDLGVLWFLQRQPGLQWEFVAVTNTANAFPRLILAVGLIYGALAFSASEMAVLYKLMAVFVVGLGVVAAMLGALTLLNYLSLSAATSAAATLRSTTVKTLVLCGLYFVLLVPVGVMGLKKPSGLRLAT